LRYERNDDGEKHGWEKNGSAYRTEIIRWLTTEKNAAEFGTGALSVCRYRMLSRFPEGRYRIDGNSGGIGRNTGNPWGHQRRRYAGGKRDLCSIRGYFVEDNRCGTKREC